MKSFDKMLTYFEDIFTAICFALMSVITIVAVFFRYVMSMPIIWSEELSRYLLIWGILIGISIVTRKNAQLGIEVFVSYAPKKIRKILEIVSQVLLILTYVLIFYLSIVFIIGTGKIGQTTPILGIPFSYVYIALPICFALSTYRAVQILWREQLMKQNH